MAYQQYYCGGYGQEHLFSKPVGRPYFSCSKCRWTPGYKDSEEQKEKVLSLLHKGKK